MLTNHYEAFRGRHEAKLRDNGLLNEDTQDAFDLLCRTFHELKTLIICPEDRISTMKFISLTKSYLKQSEQWGLQPNIKKPRIENRDGWDL